MPRAALRDLLLQQLATLRWTPDYRPDLPYRGPADFVLRHGQWYEITPWPLFWSQMAAKACFGNSIILAETESYRYIEGYALDPGNWKMAIHHAWNIDQEGLLRDSTWANGGLAYFGVEFSAGRADDATWNGDATVIDDFHRDWPILHEPWRGEDWTREWEPSEPIVVLRSGLAELDQHTHTGSRPLA